MSGRVREWLPRDAASGPRVRDALEGAVDAWSDKWFAGARASLAAVEPRSAGAPYMAGGWLLYGASAAVPDGSPDALRLAGLALGADPESLVLSEPDRDIIGRLAAAILADLAAALCVALGRPLTGNEEATPRADPLAGDAGIVLGLADARGNRLAEAAVPLGALASFLRSSIPARKVPPLGRMDRALDRTAARLDVRLGETRLTLGDLAGLAPGDVVVLDRTVAAGARVALARGEPFAGAALDAGGPAARLVLTHEPRDA